MSGWGVKCYLRSCPEKKMSKWDMPIIYLGENKKEWKVFKGERYIWKHQLWKQVKASWEMKLKKKKTMENKTIGMYGRHKEGAK